MTTPADGAWRAPRHLPVFFDVPEQPPEPRIRFRADMTPLGLALAIIRSGGWIAALGCLLLICFNSANTLIPVALGAAIDRGIGPATRGAPVSQTLGAFVAWTAVVAALYVVINLTYRFGGRMGWFCVQRAQYELSARVVGRILDVRGMAGAPSMPGRLLSVATSDTSRTCSALYFAIYPIGNVVAIVVTAASLFLIHPALGTMVVIGAPTLLAVMAVVARPLRDHSAREQARIADASGAAEDLVRGHRVLSGIHAQGAATAQYRVTSRAALRGSLRTNTAEASVTGTTTVLTGLFAGAVAVTAAFLAFDGAITIGQLVAAAGLAQVVLSPLQILVEEAATVGATVLASARRVLDLLSTEHHPAALGTATVRGRPTLRITDAHLGSIEVADGELVVVDVPGDRIASWTDALTSTGASDPSVTVDLDGTRVDDLDPAGLRSTVLFSPRRPDLLEPTLSANVHADPETARSALRVARCESLEHELPGGFQAPVGDGGRTLSGGQRQRVALARAVAHDPPVLVLCDPTSSVDAATEHDIAERLRTARSRSATLVITSSPAFHAVATRSVRSVELDRDGR